MSAKCAGCSDEATEPTENEGTDAGTLGGGAGHRSIHNSSAGGTGSPSCLVLVQALAVACVTGSPFLEGSLVITIYILTVQSF